MTAEHEYIPSFFEAEPVLTDAAAGEALAGERERIPTLFEAALIKARKVVATAEPDPDACVNPECSDGRVYDGAHYRACPDCLAQQRMKQLRRDLVAANIPESDLDATWEGLNLTHPSWQAARRYCDRIQEIAERGYNAIFAGEPGRGKSLAGVMTCKAAITAGLSARMLPAADIMSEIQRTYRPGAGDSEYDIVQRLAEVDVLVIDDLDAGSTKSRAMEVRILTGLIDKREKAKRPTVITTNLMSADEIEAAMGFRALERIKYRAAQVIFDGPNEREKAHRASVADLDAFVMGDT